MYPRLEPLSIIEIKFKVPLKFPSTIFCCDVQGFHGPQLDLMMPRGRSLYSRSTPDS